MQLYYLILILFLSWERGITLIPNETNAQTQKELRVETCDLTYRIIPSAKRTFGYVIYRNTHPLIRQETIPAIQGSCGFAKFTDAEKVAKAVIKKIKDGEVPPSLSMENLKELGVLNDY